LRVPISTSGGAGANQRIHGGEKTVTKPPPKETRGFQAEAKQVLHLMIHSVYSNKEIFLRELVSNASDACDKLRFEALTDSTLFDGGDGGDQLAIRISYDVPARTITVSDNGVGMSREEVVDHIGTVAKSGTQEFLQRLTGDQTKDAQLIGQFGVGFYSAFVVAERVTLVTRRAGLPATDGVRWESAGEGEYTLEPVEKTTRGTDVILHLRTGEDDLLADGQLRGLLLKYSDHIALPILMKKEHPPETEASAKPDQADQGDQPGEPADAVEPAESEESAPKEEFEKVNQAAALWARPKAEIDDAHYEEFYKHVAHDFEPPLAHIHVKVEGRQEYALLLFVPQRAPFDLWDRDHRRGIKLYVKRVFIMDDADQLMPSYLRFVRGVVDSSDLPLNISREILQHSSDVQAIRKASITRILSLLEGLAKSDEEKYKKFWREFGAVFKEGVGEDRDNKDRIAKLLRFSTTRTDGDVQSLSLSEYVERMKDGQQAIYYIAADGAAAARNSPHLEIFRKQEIEVLLLSDRVDEWVTSHLTEFDGKPLHSVTKGDLDLGTLGKTQDDDATPSSDDEHKALTDRLKKALGSKTQTVRVTSRLTDSPACLVSDHPMSRNLERMLKEAGQAVPTLPPVMEINRRHPIVERLNDETDDQRFSDWAHILFDQALLAEGGQLEDPAGFVKRLNELMLAMSGQASRIWTPPGS